MQLSTGLLPRRAVTRERMASDQHFEGAEADHKTVIQKISWIRDQRKKPSCVGQAFAVGVDSKLIRPPWCSGVDLWRDARRRQGRLESVLKGTRAEYVIASMMERGWSPYKEGEDDRSMRLDDDATGSLADEMFAHDMRQLNVSNFDISRNRTENVINALQLGYVVAGGWGLNDSFFRPKADTVLDAKAMNGSSSGHEMRIVAYDADRKAFMLQNSWSERWSWCRIGDRNYKGCCLISVEALEAAWDIDAIEIKLK